MFYSIFAKSLRLEKAFQKIGKGFYNKSCYCIVFLVTIWVSILISGCGTSGNAPVDSRSKPNKSSDIALKLSRRPLYYKVKKGDTLYSIAWQYGLDYKRLAYWNNIKDPYIIFIGKKLRLASNYQRKKQLNPKIYSRKGKNANKKTVKLAKVKKKKSNKNKASKKVVSKKKATKKRSEKRYSGKQGKQKVKQSKQKVKQKIKQKAKPQNVKKPSKNRPKTAVKKKKSNTKTTRSGLKWDWPIKGKVIQKFSPSKGKKGIDIAAKIGIKVKAAEAGKVVYSGHGLTGYGLLLIIKHNSEYLSAYAHNSQLIVKESEVVKKGQVIAYTGKTATDRAKLHFEIRKNGQPVNPLKYLP